MLNLANSAKDLLSLAGYRSPQNIIVFESDDWGGIRIPSSEALEELQGKYPDLPLDHYQIYDGLESAEDLALLGDTLRRFETKSGFPKFTLNYATANPVFDMRIIEDEELSPFSYEPITDTFERYDGSDSALNYYLNNPSSSSCFLAQLHAREHLNVTRWMQGARNIDHQRDAFMLGVLGFNTEKYNSMDPLNTSNVLVNRTQYITDAAKLFKEQFGFVSSSFIPPCYVINGDDYEVLSRVGVETIQGAWLMNRPKPDGSLSRRLSVPGKINRYSQVQLVRNCSFEPSKYFFHALDEEESVTRAMAEISAALKRKQPAIICSHRVNFTSRISKANRDYSLRCLNKLLNRIVEEVEDPVFMFSDQLGKAIREAKGL